MALAFLVICSMPISSVNANDLQDEISYNDVMVDNTTVIVAIKSVDAAYGSLTNYGTNIISLDREARPPTLGILNVYQATNTSIYLPVDVGKINLQSITVKGRSSNMSLRNPRDGITNILPSVKYKKNTNLNR